MKFSELVYIAEEIVSSYDYDNTSIKLIKNLYGHNILPWKVHGGKFIKPDAYNNINNNTNNETNINGDIIKEGEVYAIEFFTSNGDGLCKLYENKNDYTHYNIPEDVYTKKTPLFPNKDINSTINLCKDKFKTLPFCPNFIEKYQKKAKNTKKY